MPPMSSCATCPCRCARPDPEWLAFPEPSAACGRRALEDLLDQVNASSWTVEFVAEMLVGRARRKTESTVHAAADQVGGIGPSERSIDTRIRWVAEIVYFPLDTALLQAARALGCRTLDGGGMAVFQAVEAFALFTGVEPDALRMRRILMSWSGGPPRSQRNRHPSGVVLAFRQHFPRQKHHRSIQRQARTQAVWEFSTG